MKRLPGMGAGEASTDEKTSKNSAKQCKTVILAPKRPLQLSKFKFLNSKFEFQASSCITDLKYHIYEASAGYGRRGGFHRRENVEKQCKTVQNSNFGAKTTVTALKIQNFEFKI
jgi:hypothetical protein